MPAGAYDSRRNQEMGMSDFHEELSVSHHDPLIRNLHRVVRASVKVLAVLMVAVILAALLDVVYVFYESLRSPPFLFITVGEIFKLFGAFMVVLIAIEIFINIRLYLGSNVIPVQLVLATALMAIARKVIVLDLETISALYVFGIGAVVLALGVTYWLVGKNGVGE
jgi:uncharacterized membrane protein (DUF373 family)